MLVVGRISFEKDAVGVTEIVVDSTDADVFIDGVVVVVSVDTEGFIPDVVVEFVVVEFVVGDAFIDVVIDDCSVT